MSTDELVPKKVVVLEDYYVIHVSCGMNHTLIVTGEGFIFYKIGLCLYIFLDLCMLGEMECMGNWESLMIVRLRLCLRE